MKGAYLKNMGTVNTFTGRYFLGCDSSLSSVPSTLDTPLDCF